MSLAPLTRCITSPLALAAAKLTGADPSVSALIVVLTGIIGASFGDSFLNWIGVRDPVAVRHFTINPFTRNLKFYSQIDRSISI